MAITLTDRAAQHVERMLQQQHDHQKPIGLRVSARKSGCTGFSYVVDYADEVNEEDQVYQSHGIKILVDSASRPLLDGMTVDFVKHNLLNEGFDFINPNIKETCGCGESFSV